MGWCWRRGEKIGTDRIVIGTPPPARDVEVVMGWWKSSLKEMGGNALEGEEKCGDVCDVVVVVVVRNKVGGQTIITKAKGACCLLFVCYVFAVVIAHHRRWGGRLLIAHWIWLGGMFGMGDAELRMVFAYWRKAWWWLSMLQHTKIGESNGWVIVNKTQRTHIAFVLLLLWVVCWYLWFL